MNVKEENYPISDGKFLSIFFYLTHDKKTIYRSYDKLIKVMAEVGGLLNAFYVFSKICFYPCIQIILYAELLKNYYFPKDEEMKKKKKTIDFSVKKKNIIHCEPEIQKVKINTNISFLKQIQTNICSLFVNYYLNYKSKNLIYQNLAFDNLLSQIEISNMLRKFHEFDVLKTFIFDKKQLELFNSMPIIVRKTSINAKKDSNFHINLCEKLLSEIINRDTKSEIDQKLIDLFY